MTVRWPELGAAFAALALIAAGRAHAAVSISSGATRNIACSAGVCVPNADAAVLNVNDLQNLLGSGNVKITTTGVGVQAQDILVRASLSWNGSSTLALDAFRSVAVGKTVTVAGQGNLSITTDDGGKGGTFSFAPNASAVFADLSSTLTINGAQYALVGNIASLAADIEAEPGGSYALANAYDAGKDGQYSQSPIVTIFTGSFDGLGNTISNLQVRSNGENIGLFSEVDSPGVVENLVLRGIKMVASGTNARLGGLVGLNEGLLVGDQVEGISLTGNKSFVGGLAGISYGTIIRDSSRARISGATAGGLVGYSCSWCIHGATGLITQSDASGDVSGPDEAVAGGLVGTNLGTISKSYATGAVKGGAGSEVGGLVGGSNGTGIADSYATGAVYGFDAGGLIGLSYDTVGTSYSTGAVSGPGNGSLGGLIGADDAGSGHVSDCYWDTDTSGIANLGQGAGNKTDDPGITGLTTAQFRSGLPAGFARKTWAESAKLNAGLPYLIPNPPQH